jgi:hypothetical protein
MKRTRAGATFVPLVARLLAALLVAALLLAACGGDDSGDQSAHVSEAEYMKAMATAFNRRTTGSNPIANSKDEANCTAGRIVDNVGQEHLEKAGITAKVLKSDSFGTNGFPELSSKDASKVVDAIFQCIDVGQSLGKQLVAGGPTPTQAQCLDEKLKALPAFHSFYESILQHGNQTTMGESAAGDVVDTLFKCIGQGEFFQSSVAGTITLTPAQVECLNQSLASSSDYRDALVASFTGKQPPSGDPPYRDEVEQCVTSEQLTPTTTG